jgi:chemotaxis protein MotB
MRKLLIALSLSSVMFGIGCAGNQDRIDELERELAAARNGKTALEDELAAARERAKAADALAAARQRLYDELRDALSAYIDAGTLSITVRNGLIVVQLPNKVLFESGKADVSPEGSKTLVDVAAALANVKNRRVFVGGHTDNQPIKASGFKDNWELSARRSYNVHMTLVANGLPAQTSATAAFADTDPVSDNADPEGRAENRRIEIFLLPNLDAILPELQASASAR